MLKHFLFNAYSGLESRLIGKEDPMLARGSEKMLSTGFQIAYGFIAVVDDLKSYNEEAMTLFDYRLSNMRSSLGVKIVFIIDRDQ